MSRQQKGENGLQDKEPRTYKDRRPQGAVCLEGDADENSHDLRAVIEYLVDATYPRNSTQQLIKSLQNPNEIALLSHFTDGECEIQKD